MVQASDDVQTIREGIKELLEAHAADPFGVLREAGVQAELRDLILRRLGTAGRDRTELILEHKEHARFEWPDRCQTKRVQLELKICEPATVGGTSDEVRAGLDRDRADIVVLRQQSVKLLCYPNGPGDVVAAVSPKDVLAAVEIKASPSKHLGQKVAYAEDIQSLLRLAEGSAAVAGFFVLLDKSQDLYGRWAKFGGNANPIRWPSAHPKTLGELTFGDHKLKQSWQERVPNYATTLIAPQNPADRPSVEIWSLASSESAGRWTPKCWFAYSA